MTAPTTSDTPANIGGATGKLVEPSFADLIAGLEQAADLPDRIRRHWVCSVRQIAKWLERPLVGLPARWNAVRLAVGHLHHAHIGNITAKTVANHKSNLRTALCWFGNEHNVPQVGARLTPEWARFRDGLDQPTRSKLFNFIRYCSARGIDPPSVDDAIFQTYWAYRTEFSAMASGNATRRPMVRAWNICAATCQGWSLQLLAEPPIKVARPTWDEFPEGLRRGLDYYLAGFAKPRRSANGKRIPPCSPATIANRRAELVAVVRMAVRLGVPIESLTSVGELLKPEIVEKVIDAYWRKNGEEPKTGTIDLGWKLAQMAHATNCLDQSALERLDEIRATLEQHRHEGLTEKNLKLIREVLTDGVWSKVVSLPKALMRQARAMNDHAPIKAAVCAQLAVAISILTLAPIRLRNLVSIQLGQNLIKPGGLDTPYWLVFPNYDVKNRVDLNFQFDDALTCLIDEYIHDFRPTLLRGANAAWLFPGEGGQPKMKLFFSNQITERILKATGLRITVHQFRHAAAAIYLKHRPGDYETVRRLLGHRNIWTTIKFYCGLETIEATQQFGKLIREHIDLDTDD